MTSWWGLLSRNPQEIRVELTDPVITLTRVGKNGYLLPAFRTRTKAGNEPQPIAVDLGLANATVRIVGGGLPTDTLAKKLDLVGRMHGAGKTWEFALGRFAATLPNPGLRIEKAEGRMRVADDRLALDRLRMRTGAGWIEAAGGGPIVPRFDIEGSIKAGEWTWHDLSRLLKQPALDLPGGIAGEARVRVRPDTLAVTGAEADILWRGEPRASFDATRQGGLALTARDSTGATPLSGAGSGSIPGGAGGSTARSTGSSSRTCRGSGRCRRWSRCSCPGTSSSRDKTGLDARVARPRHVAELSFDSLAGTWSLAGRTQALDARVRAAGARLREGMLGRTAW